VILFSSSSIYSFYLYKKKPMKSNKTKTKFHSQKLLSVVEGSIVFVDDDFRIAAGSGV
jgi:hypothetical protein